MKFRFGYGFIAILLLFLAAGCAPVKEAPSDFLLTPVKVKNAFFEGGITLVQNGLVTPKGLVLNGISPTVMEMKKARDNYFFVYTFGSPTDREKGFQELGNRPETYKKLMGEKLIGPFIYEAKNILIVYLATDDHEIKKIRDIVFEKLNEGKAPVFEGEGTHWEIRAALEKRGQIIGAYDILIAAHALSENLILVTNNTNEFSRIPNLPIRNWAD